MLCKEPQVNFKHDVLEDEFSACASFLYAGYDIDSMFAGLL